MLTNPDQTKRSEENKIKWKKGVTVLCTVQYSLCVVSRFVAIYAEHSDSGVRKGPWGTAAVNGHFRGRGPAARLSIKADGFHYFHLNRSRDTEWFGKGGSGSQG